MKRKYKAPEEKAIQKRFPENITFKYDWRKYQHRVLSELENHLDDNHLHIIAPPGSGKTVLGLEVALRLNKPTLIFAPTIAIRNQWIQRFTELFLQVEHAPDWISRDIKNPKFLTVSTYQGLHSACSGIEIDETLSEDDDELDITTNDTPKTTDIIKLLKAQNIGTIVVDEAHHLKNAWWKSLSEIKKALNPTIVGLTATPPYDVSRLEWQRYIELNGPVDTEISVPELVVEGDLCPHQDYVYFSRPTDEECKKIEDFRSRIQRLVNDIKTDEILIRALENHPIFKTPQQELEWIYSNIEYYSATLIFLNAIGKVITQEHLEIVGEKSLTIPDLNYEWIEILLTFYLYKDPINFSSYNEHQEKLTNKLKRNGAIERRTIKFRNNKKLNSFLSSSISKLKSIDKIVDFEHRHLNNNLRMVILTDYIRKEFLVNDSSNELELNKIGVMPIFEQLRRTNDRNMKIGVLTGSLIIIPTSAFEAFKTTAARFNIHKLSTSPVAYDDQYLIINSTSQLKHDIVHIITSVFENGHIEVLVGTKSLLGEGWDAPSINALVLASFVGSYVLSNQMRGRAIRTAMENPDKTGNIWHLVCIDPTATDGGDDFQLLQRRLKAFVGISSNEKVNIENGISRLNIPKKLASEKEINSLNNRTLSQAVQRDLLKEKWKLALATGTNLTEEIKVPFPEELDYKALKKHYSNHSIKYLLCTVGFAILIYLVQIVQIFGESFKYMFRNGYLLYFTLVVLVVGLLLFGRKTFKSIRTYIKYRDIAKDIQQIGETLLVSLIKIGAIHSSRSNLIVKSSVDEFGCIFCHLEGGSTYEKSIFITSLQEITDVIDNPRYIIIRKSYFLDMLSQKDYHSVPEMIGRKKAYALEFKYAWSRYVGKCELVYTRTVKGRKILLKSRVNSLASEFENKSERVNKWR